MQTSDELIKDFLREHDKDLEAATLGEAARPPSAKDVERLRQALRALVKRNEPIVRTLLVLVMALTVTAAVMAIVLAAVGGSGSLGFVSGLAGAAILPVGYFLRSVWQEKFRVQVLLELLPGLAPDRMLDALERYLFRHPTPPSGAPDDE